jgi:dipeptidase E
VSKQIISIGGGGFGRNPKARLIEKYILDQCPKENPNILFIPTASAEDSQYTVNFYQCFSGLDCNPSHLNLFARTPNLKSLIAKQDIIYVGGGNTKSMLGVWKEWKLDQLLLKAYEKGTILCGVSAGAICWFEKGVTDSWASHLNLIDCLGFLEGTCCPHFDGEKDRRPSVHAFLETEAIPNCLAIDDNAALHFKDGKIYSAINFGKDKGCYRVKKEGADILEHKISAVVLK